MKREHVSQTPIPPLREYRVTRVDDDQAEDIIEGTWWKRKWAYVLPDSIKEEPEPEDEDEMEIDRDTSAPLINWKRSFVVRHSHSYGHGE